MSMTLTQIATASYTIVMLFSQGPSQIPLVYITSLIPQHFEWTGRVGIFLRSVAHTNTDTQIMDLLMVTGN